MPGHAVIVMGSSYRAESQKKARHSEERGPSSKHYDSRSSQKSNYTSVTELSTIRRACSGWWMRPPMSLRAL